MSRKQDSIIKERDQVPVIKIYLFQIVLIIILRTITLETQSSQEKHRQCSARIVKNKASVIVRIDADEIIRKV